MGNVADEKKQPDGQASQIYLLLKASRKQNKWLKMEEPGKNSFDIEELLHSSEGLLTEKEEKMSS